MISGEQVIDLNYAYRSMLEAEGVIRSVQVAEAFVPANMLEFLQGGEQSIELVKKAIDYVQKHGDAVKYKVFHSVPNIAAWM